MKIDQKELVRAALVIIVSIAAVAGCWQIGHGLRNFRQGENKIKVTGMAEKQITSDLIVWNITVSGKASTKSAAYTEFNRSNHMIRQYLRENNIADSAISTNSVSIEKQTKSLYDTQAERYFEVDDGYLVSQDITITSRNLPIVERVYQKISVLYGRDVNFSSSDPLYYYTKLDDLKMQLLNEASIDAYKRAETIAEGCNASVGSLQSSTMGVFQIVGLDSSEDYSWGGTFNTAIKRSGQALQFAPFTRQNKLKYIIIGRCKGKYYRKIYKNLVGY